MSTTPRAPGAGRPGAIRALLLAAALCLPACGTASGTDTSPPSATATPSGTPAPAGQATPAPKPTPLPVNVPADYQLGKAYPPPRGVRALSRDRTAAPVRGLYNICYVNAYQAQPDELGWWQHAHPDLLLRDRAGRYVVDTTWNETLLDISTPARAAAVAAIVDGWIDGCGAHGFQAVEPDNIDSYQRSTGLLTQAQALSYLTLIAAHAHQRGLAIAQKNAGELGTAGRDRARLDFAITEECGQNAECADYTAVYGQRIIDIEYDQSGYAKACAAVGRTITVVLRDIDVTGPDSETYVYATC